MITGFNTDIVYEGVTYHVQTEDKGLSRPIILSLVYDRGTILASKRSPYNDLLDAGFDEKELEERLHKQHRTICAAVKAGRIEDLIKMTRKAADQPEKAIEPAANGNLANPVEPLPVINENVSIPKPDSSQLPIPIPVNDKSLTDDGSDFIEIPAEITEFDLYEDLEDAILLPSDAVQIVKEASRVERPMNNRLSIEFIGDTKFTGGERRTVVFLICRGSDRKVVGDAPLVVKVLGSSFRPLIFHAVSDKNGLAKVNLQLPTFRSGRAAIYARVMDNGEEVEVRRTILHG